MTDVEKLIYTVSASVVWASFTGKMYWKLFWLNKIETLFLSCCVWMHVSMNTHTYAWTCESFMCSNSLKMDAVGNRSETGKKIFILHHHDLLWKIFRKLKEEIVILGCYREKQAVYAMKSLSCWRKFSRG